MCGDGVTLLDSPRIRDGSQMYACYPRTTLIIDLARFWLSHILYEIVETRSTLIVSYFSEK